MAIASAPPPLSVPPQFGKDKAIGAFFTALLNTIFQMWVALYASKTDSKVLTTDNIATPIFRVTIVDGTCVMLICNIAAHRTGGANGAPNDSGYFQIEGAYKNNGGVLSGIGATAHIIESDQGTWTVGLTSFGTSAVVTVTGATGNNITWQGTLTTVIAGA